MTSPLKRVFYVRYLADPVYRELMAARGDYQLDGIDDTTSKQDADAIIGAAHVYQIGTVRSELEPPLRAGAELLARAPNLLIVSTHGAGYDTIDLEACTRAGVIALNQAGGNAESVAEHALGMLLCLTKRIGETDHFMRRAPHIKRLDFMGMQARGKTLGIIGLGHIGTRLAEMCSAALKMKVIACDPYLDEQAMQARGARKVDLDTLLRTADYVSANCPLTDETRGMLGRTEFARMQRHAIFVSTARAFIHEEAALIEALQNKQIAAAGLDVWEQEPPPPDHPLLKMENVLASPHTGGATHDSRQNIATLAAEQVFATFEGVRPARLLNPQAWPVFARRFKETFGVTFD